jgi:undecaprenyl-diphosphatase
MLLVLLVLALGATVWAVTGLRRRLVPLVQRWRLRLVQHLQARDGRGARLLAAALAPAAPGTKGVVTGAFVLLAAGWLFLAVLEDIATQDALVQADLSVFAFLQQLRTDAADQAAIVVTEAGSVGVLLPLIVVVLAWLLARRCWRAAGYWVASAAFAEGLVQVLKHGLARQRPSLLYAGTERFSFPSGHATMSAVVLGLLAFLLTRGQSQRWRSVVMGTVAVYVVLVAFSRLYLGAHWFSDVAGGMSLGLAWVAFVAMVYNQRGTGQEPLAPRALALVSLLALAVSLLLWNQWRGPVDQQMYAVLRQPRLLPEADWLGGGWRAVPLRRREFAGDEEEPFTLQWACDAAGVRQALGQVGWQPAVPWAPASALLALAGPGELGRVPVLPRFDQGRRSVLRFVRLAPDAKGIREVLQLWQADVQVVTASGARLPVWYGTTYSEHWSRRGVPRLQPVTPEAAILAQQLHSAAGLQRQGEGAGWPELLVCPAGEPVVRQAPSRP